MSVAFEPIQWEETSCDWCGSSESELLFKGPDRLEQLPGEFTMVRCSRCGLFRQSPRPAWVSLKNYYPENYASYPPLVRTGRNVLRRLDKRYGPWKRLRAIQRFQSRGKLLEVGCGTGLFLEEALRSNRWSVTGIEPNTKTARYAQQMLQVPVYQGRFSEVKLPSQSFDVIAFWNVLEHLDHPIRDLRYAHQLLKDNAWLVIAIPNAESLEARLFGQFWVGWDLPRHLYVFPRSTLYTIMESLGFRIQAKRCISTSYSVLGHSLDFWSQSWGGRFPGVRHLLLRLYGSIVVRAGLIPPLWLLDRFHTSTIITYFAQKIPSTDTSASR